MLSKSELMLVRVIKKRLERGETIEDVINSYTALADDNKRRIIEYVENN